MPNLTINGVTPVAAWIPTLDDTGNGTTTLYDLVSGTYNGTLTSMVPASDWVTDNSNTYTGSGRALDFDGSNDRVECGAISVTTNWTITLWVKQVAFSPAIAYPIGTGGNSGVFTEYNAGSDAWGYYDGSGAVDLAGQDLGTGVWYFLAVTRSGTSYELFVDNVSDGTATMDGADISAITIGTRGGTTLPYKGLIDDVRVFDSVLSSATRAALYNSGNGRGVVGGGASSIIPAIMHHRRQLAG